MLSDRTQIGPLPDSSGESGWGTDSCSLPSALQTCHCGIANLLSLISNLPPLTLRDPSHDTQTSHQGRDAARTNGVVRLRTGFKSTAHEYPSISCLLCTANVRAEVQAITLAGGDGVSYTPRMLGVDRSIACGLAKGLITFLPAPATHQFPTRYTGRRTAQSQPRPWRLPEHRDA